MAVMTMERPESDEDAASQELRRRRTAVVRALHDQIDPPEGWRVEILGGQLVVSSTPFGMHAYILMRIREAVAPALPAGYRLFENTTLEEPAGDRFVPDLTAWPTKLMRTDSEWVFPGDLSLLTVEVTSPDQERRDYEKASRYARSGVPVFLLVDRKRRVCVVHSEPEGDHYSTRLKVSFGKPVSLPMETPVTVETSEF